MAEINSERIPELFEKLTENLPPEVVREVLYNGISVDDAINQAATIWSGDPINWDEAWEDE